MIDLLCPSKKLKLKANLKPLIDFETIAAVHRRNKLFKKYKKLRLESISIGRNSSSESYMESSEAFRKEIKQIKSIKNYFEKPWDYPIQLRKNENTL